MAGVQMEMNIEAFRCYRPQSGDVLIVKPVPGVRLGTQQVESICHALKRVLPEDIDVVVLHEHLEIDVIHKGDAT